MLIPPIPKVQKRRAKKSRAKVVAPPQALTLVSASFDPGFPEAFLTFDREIDIQNIHGLAFTVDDGQFTGNLYTCTPFGASHPATDTLRMTLQVVGTASGGQVLLRVLENNGIVAVDDGGTWAGVMDLELPFPPPPAPLVLESASLDAGELSVTLVFDRAIEIGSIHPTAFRVADGPADDFYMGANGGGSLMGPKTLKVMLESVGEASGAEVLLTVLSSSGIVAVDDGGTWTGVVQRVLPFP